MTVFLARSTPRVLALFQRIPPWALVVIAIISVQIGAALATSLFQVATPSGVVFLRCFLGGSIFWALWPPRWRSYDRLQRFYIVLYGINIAAMMLSFYASLRLVPLGIAVAVAFAGPLVVAVIGSHKPLDLLWVFLAGLGVVLLSPSSAGEISVLGMLFTAFSGLTWGIYIVLSKRMTRLFRGANNILGPSMLVGALTAAPVGLLGGLRVLTASVGLLLTALLVVILSSFVPFLLEYQAMQRMPSRAYSLLLSLEPVMAVIVGFVLLHQALGLREIVGIACVTIAAAATAQAEA